MIFGKKCWPMEELNIKIDDLQIKFDGMNSLYEYSIECYRNYLKNSNSQFEILKNIIERLEKIENYIKNEKFIRNIVDKE